MLNPSSWCIQSIKNPQQQIKNEEIMAPQSGGGWSRTQNNKPQTVLEHPKTSLYVALLLL
jgi:hypothetical protein